MKSFILIGAAGFVAQRHMRAIKDTGNDLVAALDRHDNVGILDSYFPSTQFFTDLEGLDLHLRTRRTNGQPVDYLSVCSPNHLHQAHSQFGLYGGMDVICEKPLVLHPSQIDEMAIAERESGRRLYNVLQLRYHPAIQSLREKVAAAPADKVFDVDLTYLTSRGAWYYASWKGDVKKSGGIATNIGVHFFDMLSWIFGESRENVVHQHNEDVAAGYLSFSRARVRWFLSINEKYLPAQAVDAGKRTFRSITIDGEELEFSEGFTDLHTLTYRNILNGNGYGLADARPAIEVVDAIRTLPVMGLRGDYHPFCNRIV